MVDEELIKLEPRWDGLARQIMMAFDIGLKTPRGIFEHLKRCGAHIPQWLQDEPEMQCLDHVVSTDTRCVILRKAMLPLTQDADDHVR